VDLRLRRPLPERHRPVHPPWHRRHGAGAGGGLASKYLIDAVTGHLDGLILTTALIYAALGLGRLILTAFGRQLSAKLSVTASNHIRSEVFKQFLTIDWQSSLDYHSGDLLTRVSQDVSTVSDSILGWIPSLITCLVQFFGTLAVILFFDPVMALLALVSARLDELQELYRDVRLDYEAFSIKIHLLMSTVGFGVSGLCFAWGVYRLWSGYISFGTMVLFIQMASLLACAWDFVEKLPGQLEHKLKERGLGLSEGQLQRLAIARALLSDAPVILLDEATSALDLATERKVLANMLSSGRSRTVIVTTHRPTVLHSCARVYSIREGRAELLSSEEIAELTGA